MDLEPPFLGEARLRVADGLALRLGVRAVELACALTSSVQGAIAASGDAGSKADASPVTVADYGAQALVSASLAAAYGPPADTTVSLVAEETAEELKAADSDGAILAEVARLVNAAIRGAGEGGDSQLLELSEAPAEPPTTPPTSKLFEQAKALMKVGHARRLADMTAQLAAAVRARKQ